MGRLPLHTAGCGIMMGLVCRVHCSPRRSPLPTCALRAASRCSFRSFFRLSMMRFCSISWSSNPARSLQNGNGDGGDDPTDQEPRSGAPPIRSPPIRSASAPGKGWTAAGCRWVGVADGQRRDGRHRVACPYTVATPHPSPALQYVAHRKHLLLPPLTASSLAPTCGTAPSPPVAPPPAGPLPLVPRLAPASPPPAAAAAQPPAIRAGPGQGTWLSAGLSRTEKVPADPEGDALAAVAVQCS